MLVTMTYGGVYTEFYTIDDQTYMLMPDISFYQTTDETSGLLDSLFLIDSGYTVSSTETADGVTTEVYSSTDSSGGKGTYTFKFDEETGDILSLDAESDSDTISVTVNSIDYEGEDIAMPDITGWQDMTDTSSLDDAAQIKLALYYMGIDEEQVEEAGYTYEELAEMSSDELSEAFTKLGADIFN
jgi:hypothetical protein